MALGNFNNLPDENEKRLLRSLVFNSTLEEDERSMYYFRISCVADYDTYQKLQYELEDVQPTIRHLERLSETQLNRQLKKHIK